MYPPVEPLHSRAGSLVAEFEQGGGTSYIEGAIDLDREALDLCPPGHPTRSVSLACLAHHLWLRYGRLGVTGDLEEAVVLVQEALDLCPQGHPLQSISLNSLAICLATRYEKLGAMGDLNEAIVFFFFFFFVTSFIVLRAWPFVGQYSQCDT